MTENKHIITSEGGSCLTQDSPDAISSLPKVKLKMGTQKCIWMDAESVEYQLCPLNRNCDQCDFHQQMMKGYRRGADIQDNALIIRTPELAFVQFTPGIQFIHRHFWIKRTGKGKIHLGVDAFMWQILASVQKIISAKVNTSLLKGQCFSWLQLRDEIIYLRTPLAGKILRTNPLFDVERLVDTHIYLSPEESLWFIELELEDPESHMNVLSKDLYLEQSREDFFRFKELGDGPEKEKSHALVRRSLVSKNKFSKYLLDVSDNLIYVC